MFKLIHFKILCTKWAHFKFDACYRSQNSWDGGMFTMVYSISSSFQNSLKMSAHRGYEFLEFWCCNLVPFLPGLGFQLLKSSWSSLMYFSFNDAPNVLYRWKIWTADRPIQQPDSSTTKPCCCNSCSMWFPSSLARRTRHPWFPTRMSNLDSSDHRTLSTLKQSILNEPWDTGHNGASGQCSHMASFLHDRALVGTCRWHGGLCLPTVVSGSIPGPI